MFEVSDGIYRGKGRKDVRLENMIKQEMSYLHMLGGGGSVVGSVSNK